MRNQLKRENVVVFYPNTWKHDEERAVNYTTFISWLCSFILVSVDGWEYLHWYSFHNEILVNGETKINSKNDRQKYHVVLDQNSNLDNSLELLNGEFYIYDIFGYRRTCVDAYDDNREHRLFQEHLIFPIA